MWAWGAEDVRVHAPKQIPGVTGAVAVAGSAYQDQYRAAYALMPDGTVWAWGGDDSGQLGSGGDCHNNGCPASADPVQVSNLSGVTALAADQSDINYAAYALRSDGTVWAGARTAMAGSPAPATSTRAAFRCGFPG